jgi:hypothetical protein
VDVLTFNANLAISGGVFDLGGQSRLSGEFKVIGDAATITIDRLNGAPGQQQRPGFRNH